MRNSMRVRGAMVAGVAAVLAGTARGQTTVVLEASADNTVYSDSPGNSNGRGPGLFAGTTSSLGIRRALVRFDLSAIPLHAPIAGATLTLHMNKTVSGAATVRVHRLLEDWGEGLSNAGEPGGMGTPAQAGDATWDFAFFVTTAWTTAGGVYESTASAFTGVDQTGTYAWSSAGLTGDVQRWADAPGENLGWVVVGDEGGFSTAKRFDSRESVTASFRPTLTVEYYCPADFDRNGFVNGDDFDAFTLLFELGDPGADWDRNTFVTGDDFDGFMDAFALGC